MMRAAAEGQVVDVGLFGLGPLSHVVHLGQVAGHIAARSCTSAVLGVEHDPLVSVPLALRTPPMLTGETNVRPVDGPAVTDRDKH
jgi:hypothetical protein